MSTPAITSDLSQPGAQSPQAPTQAPAPGPHSRLMSMIQGLAVGVGAFAESAATQGRAGGPEEVQRFQAEQQREQAVAQESQQSAQRAQREQQEGDLRIRTMQAQLVMNAASFHHAVQLWPTEDKEKMLDLSNKADLAYKNAWDEGYDITDPGQAAQWRSMHDNVISIPFSAGQSPQEVLSATTDAASKNGKSIIDYVPFVDYKDAKHETGGTISLAPAAALANVEATPRQISADTALMKGTLEKATAAFGKDDPDVKKLTAQLGTWQGVLDNGGKPSAKDHRLVTLGNVAALSTRIGMHSQTLKLQQEANDAAESGSKATKAAQDADPAFVLRMEQAKAQIAQSVKDGDPKAAADLLGQGLVAPSELISARNPGFAQKALTAAVAKYPGFNPQKAEADFHVAKSEENNKFFGAANSLLGSKGSGGNFDLLAEKYAQLKNGEIPLFNKVTDYAKGAAGDPALSGFMQAAIGVADDYAKVMGGGTGTDSGRLQLLQSFSNAHNPEQMKNVIETAKRAVSSQAESRIGNNQVLRQMYGGAAVQKVATQQHIQAYAQQKGITPEQASKEFQSAGYQIK